MIRKYAAGVDGGGTQTTVVVADETGQAKQSFISGAINLNGQAEADVRNSLLYIIDKIHEISGGASHEVQLCIGVAGISNPVVTEKVHEIVRAYGFTGDILLAGDHETALYGAHECDIGIVLIAGTGSICYGRNSSRLSHRTGGFGHLIDDAGSGYWIGRELLAAVVQEQDGRIARTVISEMVYNQLGMASISDIIDYVYAKERNKKEIAALAPILTAACKYGDATALKIADECAQSLLELIHPVVLRLNMHEGNLAFSGSVLRHNDDIRLGLEERLRLVYPQLTCVKAKRDGANGAMLMALRRLKQMEH